MRTIMKSCHNSSSFSFSKRFLNWKHKQEEESEQNDEIILLTDLPDPHYPNYPTTIQSTMKTNHLSSKLRSALTAAFGRNSATKVVGTLFGHRRGHVHLAFQDDPNQIPAFLIQIATPTSVLVREMASGVVRIALECDNNKKMKTTTTKKKKNKLLEEGMWRSYINGKKCGYAMRRECGEEEWRVLAAVGAISMGAGVLPAVKGGGEEVMNGGTVDDDGEREGEGEGELMYMRAMFERVVGSKDSEAFYMMNPHGSGSPELTLYLLRV